MAGQVMVRANVFASPKDTCNLPYDDQEFIESADGHLKFTRMCFFVVERGNHWRYLEDLLSLRHRLCRSGSRLVDDSNTGCCVSLDPLQIEYIIQTIAVRVERMVKQNSHRKRIPFVATCEVILASHGQPWQREAPMRSANFSGFGVVLSTGAAGDVIEKRKRDEDFDGDDLKLEEMQLE